MPDHSLFSPSSAAKWDCPGSFLMEQGIPNISSDDADLGTAQHDCAAYCLTNNLDADVCVGKEFKGIIIDDEAADNVQIYIDTVREKVNNGYLLVETKVPVEQITLEEGGEGTADTIIISEDGETLHVIDAKFGFQKVLAKKNPQGMMYLCGALYKYAALGNFKKAIFSIVQPRIDHYDEWEYTIEELEQFADDTKFKAQFIWRLLRNEVEFKPKEDLVPSEKSCQWCRAKATCPARVNQALTIAAGDFTDLTKNPSAKLNDALLRIEHLDLKQLSWLMQNADVLEQIAKAARGRVELELFAGNEVPGFKLVEGKKGNRKWEDEETTAQTMKKLGVPIDLIYSKEVISVTKAEKLLKKDKKVWVKLHDLITQNEGKPSVAASTDPRPALQIGKSEEDFEVLDKE